MRAFVVNGDGNPIVKARRTAEAVLSSYEKETHVTEKKCVPYQRYDDPTYFSPLPLPQHLWM
jgi:hypothetical protein